MSMGENGITCFELLKTDQCERVRAIAEGGPKRPSYKKNLSQKAMDYNAPMHFGRSLEESLIKEDVEIVLTGEPKIRRVKAQRNKA